VLGDLALLARSEGDTAQTRALLEESVALYRQGKGLYDLPWAVARLADVVRGDGDIDQARSYLEESLSLFQQSGTTAGTVTVLYFAGVLASATGRHEDAVRLLAAATAHDHDTAVIYPPERTDIDAALARANDVLGDACYAQCRHEGSMWTLEHAISMVDAV
jgi:tetratricopeptide (TPR) repeat protein